MTLGEATGHCLGRLLQGWVNIAADSAALQIGGLCHDSRKLKSGDLFFALAGSRSHGMKHAEQSVATGAAAILYDPAKCGAEMAASVELGGIPCFPVERLDQLMGRVADRFFGEPSSRLEVIGVTGTNGKTSSSHFIANALDEGQTAAVIGTLGWGAPGRLEETTHTTPDAIEIHGLLAKLAAQGVSSVAMEASSHGLEQGRLNGIRFDGALFTNLSRDHLDYHHSMEAYLEAKLRLVEWPGLNYLAFNLDDQSAQAIRQRAPASLRKLGFTMSGRVEPIPGVEIVRAGNIEHDRDGLSFDAHFQGNRARVAAGVFGDFNVENLLGALAVLLARGDALDIAARRLGRVLPVPGRMERFLGGDGISAVVDYAHTPDALSKTLTSLRRHCKGKLWVVVGCGGDRDRGKRPQMGSIAERLADSVVLTDDNPRSENGDAIVEDILSGCQRRDIAVIRDRRQAIAHAVKRLERDDVLLVAGKGHEATQEIQGVKHPFSDREVLNQLLGRPAEVLSSCA